MTVELKTNKMAVYEEVAQTTSYAGKKKEGDEKAYERIFTTDEDRSQLHRFWEECRADLTEALKNYLLGESEDTNGNYGLQLELSSAFDLALKEGMDKGLFSYFVVGITSKWFAFTNKAEAGEYAAGAAAILEALRRKACHKRGPVRPTY